MYAIRKSSRLRLKTDQGGNGRCLTGRTAGASGSLLPQPLSSNVIYKDLRPQNKPRRVISELGSMSINAADEHFVYSPRFTKIPSIRLFALVALCSFVVYIYIRKAVKYRVGDSGIRLYFLFEGTDT